VDGFPLSIRFRRLYDLAQCKLVTAADMQQFVKVCQGSLCQHIVQFGGLGGYSKHLWKVFHIIWLAVVFVIWNERNNLIFRQKQEQLQLLRENVKLYSYWWLKLKHVLFDFDYQLWRLNPAVCLSLVS
jgi:hypothetical protein